MTSGTTWANDPFAAYESTKAISFKGDPPGTIKQGVVTSIDPDVQGKDPETGLPDVWAKSGTPKLSIVIGLDTDEGPRALWITKYQKNARFQAMRDAQQELGRVLQIGDTLKIAYTGDDPDTVGSPLPRKLYKVKIEPGQVGGAADPFAAPAAQPTDVPF
jgi:hypothetical protein